VFVVSHKVIICLNESTLKLVLISSHLPSPGVLARDFNHRMDEMISTVKPWIKDGGFIFSVLF
jgi:hypothetical protein